MNTNEIIMTMKKRLKLLDEDIDNLLDKIVQTDRKETIEINGLLWQKDFDITLRTWDQTQHHIARLNAKLKSLHETYWRLPTAYEFFCFIEHECVDGYVQQAPYLTSTTGNDSNEFVLFEVNSNKQKTISSVSKNTTRGITKLVKDKINPPPCWR